MKKALQTAWQVVWVLEAIAFVKFAIERRVERAMFAIVIVLLIYIILLLLEEK